MWTKLRLSYATLINPYEDTKRIYKTHEQWRALLNTEKFLEFNRRQDVFQKTMYLDVTDTRLF